MKRILITISIACVFLAVYPVINAFGADDDSKPRSNVTITVVMPEAAVTPAPEVTPTPTPTPEPIMMYPVDVRETVEGGVRQIVKTYELNATESPADIPRSDFERLGWKYSLTDILRKETASMETRDHIEKVTLNTETKEVEKILPLLSQTMEFTALDGFVGVLGLDVTSIKVETAGTRTSSYTMNITREYPHLSTNDSSFVPKTVTDKGKTYNLVGVEWKPIRVEVVDYVDVPTSYTAVATYSATGSSTVVTGYITTAEYKGVLSKLIQGKAVYTAYFIGEEIRTPLELTESPKPMPTETPTPESTAIPEHTKAPSPTDESVTTNETEPPNEDGENKPINVLYIVIPIVATIAGITFYIFNKRKGKTDHA